MEHSSRLSLFLQVVDKFFSINLTYLYIEGNFKINNSFNNGSNKYNNNRNNKDKNRDPNPAFNRAVWIDGKYVSGGCNSRVKLNLFGTADDSKFQSSDIDFDNYDDISVDPFCKDVPEPITEFTSLLLDELLMGKIKLTRFIKPTPVQKYSMPIISAGSVLNGLCSDWFW